MTLVVAGAAAVYTLRVADDCLVLSHRLAQWSSWAPTLEDDVALTNIALDLLGQNRRALDALAAALFAAGYLDRAEVAAVRVSDEVLGYISAIVTATRTSPDLALGASPRGSIALLLAGKAMAAIQGRDYVVPDDVKDVCIPALRHRMIRRPEAEIQGVSEVAAVQRAVGRVPVPR